MTVSRSGLSDAIRRSQKREFDLAGTIDLLLGRRPEDFRFETGIRLVQLQTWILYPSAANNAPAAAGRLCAARLLREIEEQCGADDYDVDSETLMHLLRQEDYRSLYDRFVGPSGGWSSAVLGAVNPNEFDARVQRRMLEAGRVAELVEYRVRAALNRPTVKDHVSAAVHFAVHSQKGQEPRTYWDAWTKLKRSAVFNYVIEKHNIPMRPPHTAGGEDLLSVLTKPSFGKRDLNRFFGTAAFAFEKLHDGEWAEYLSERLPTVPFNVASFSEKENSIAMRYEYDRLADTKAERDASSEELSETATW